MWSLLFTTKPLMQILNIYIYIYILGTNISETTIIEKLPQPKEMLSQKRVSGNNIYRFSQFFWKKCSVKNESQVIIFTGFNNFFVRDSYNCDRTVLKSWDKSWRKVSSSSRSWVGFTKWKLLCKEGTFIDSLESKRNWRKEHAAIWKVKVP